MVRRQVIMIDTFWCCKLSYTSGLFGLRKKWVICDTQFCVVGEDIILIDTSSQTLEVLYCGIEGEVRQ
jgi:hypothetical protein